MSEIDVQPQVLRDTARRCEGYVGELGGFVRQLAGCQLPPEAFPPLKDAQDVASALTEWLESYADDVRHEAAHWDGTVTGLHMAAETYWDGDTDAAVLFQKVV